MPSRKHREENGMGGRVFRNLVHLPVRMMRRLLPYFIPTLVFLLCIPLLITFSGAAGWVVWSNVPVSWQAEAFLQYGEETVPFANLPLTQMLADQPYDISLHLVLPATESNYALGNFMTTLKLTTAYNDSIITVRRPAALIPRRYSLAKQLLFSPSETVKLEIPLLSQFVSGTSSVNARLELGRSDGWRAIGNGEGRELSVLGAIIKGRVRPRGLSAVIARYPRLATAASTFIFFFISLSVVSCVLLIAVRSDSSTLVPPQRESSGSEDSGNDSDAGEDRKPFGRRRLHDRTRASGSSSTEDGKPRTSLGDIHTSSLHQRRSSRAPESAHIKIEGTPIREGQITLYPKSPYPRLPADSATPAPAPTSVKPKIDVKSFFRNSNATPAAGPPPQEPSLTLQRAVPPNPSFPQPQSQLAQPPPSADSDSSSFKSDSVISKSDADAASL